MRLNRVLVMNSSIPMNRLRSNPVPVSMLVGDQSDTPMTFKAFGFVESNKLIGITPINLDLFQSLCSKVNSARIAPKLSLNKRPSLVN